MAGRRRDEERAGITGSQTEGWRVRVRIVGVGERDRTLPGGTAYSEAVLLRETLRRELAEGTSHRPPAVPTLGDYEADWIERKRGEGLTRTTLEGFVVVLSRAPRFLLDLRLDQITRPDLQRYQAWLRTPEARVGRYTHLAGAPLAPRTIRTTWRIFLQCLRDGLADHGIQADPTARLRLLPLAEEPAGRALSAAEARTLLGCARDDFERTAVLLALTTGLRRAELCALRREDLELDGQPQLRVRGTKTRAARRVIPLSGEVADTLRLHLAGAPDSPWIFWNRQHRSPGDPSQPWRPRSFERLVERLGQEAGLGRVEPHDLRRTFVTLLHAAGVDDLSRRLVAGHTSAAVSELYTRPSASSLAEKLRPGWRLLEGDVGSGRGDGERTG